MIIEKVLTPDRPFICKTHGLRFNSETKCTICDPVCDSCGGFIDYHVNAGENYKATDPHKDCNQVTGGFWANQTPDSIA